MNLKGIETMQTVINLRDENDAYRLEAILSIYMEDKGFKRGDGTKTTDLLFFILDELNKSKV